MGGLLPLCLPLLDAEPATDVAMAGIGQKDRGSQAIGGPTPPQATSVGTPHWLV